MKNSLKFALILTLGSSLAFAQNAIKSPNAPRHPAKANHVKSNVNAILKPIEKELHQAHKIMESALPIYDGHRAFAMELDRDAMKDLQFGSKAGPNAQAPMSANKPLKKNSHSEKALAKYTPQQIADSQAKLTKALAMIQDAGTKLQNVQGTWGGYTASALQSLGQCVTELKTAIVLRGGTTSQP